MNLEKLFKMQRQLDDHIMDEHPELKGQDNLDWKILALQVELGECANEWRGFKKWSKDQEPRTEIEVYIRCGYCRGKGEIYIDRTCHKCDGKGEILNSFKNPLLEEYVDCLHFILSIGLELDFAKFVKKIEVVKNKSITEQFIFIYTKVGTLLTFKGLPNYIHIIQNFIGLGEMLGFTWDQIEQAYFDKNEINHQRQEVGY